MGKKNKSFIQKIFQRFTKFVNNASKELWSFEADQPDTQISAFLLLS